MPSYHLITYGCQMNKSDSERMETILKGVGLESTVDQKNADVILVNTCSVRQSAEDRVFSLIHSLQPLKEQRPELIIGVTGCMPGRDRHGAIRKRLPLVDLYFPTKDMGQLPRWLGEMRPELVNSADTLEDYLKVRPDYHRLTQAFVSIQTGCNKFCTYCVVPFARGLEKNRPMKDILDEIRELALHGCVEVTLLGQTVNSYRAPDPENFANNNPYRDLCKRTNAPEGALNSKGLQARSLDGGDHFAALLWEVNQINGIKRLHFTAPHPLHMTDEVIDAMTLSAHLNFIHLPVQCGDDEVLRRMNRRYTVAQYIDVVDRLRAKIPDLAIGTDIIVGFAGESPEQFEKTVELYEKIRFDISYTARYSVRSGTAAAKAFKDDVSLEEKKRRWNLLQEIQERIVLEKNQAYQGKVVSVLVDRHEPPKITDGMLAMPKKIQETMAAQPGYCFGNSREMKLVRFPGREDLVGKIVDVKITKADMWILEGEQV
ncbi:MAG: MiaB/RimO family radical SAM methylthiotransferase [Patescibacteria group bacterium]